MFSGDKPKVTFADVAGVDEAKEELQEVVEFLREPQKFISLGARIPKGCFAGRNLPEEERLFWQKPFPEKPAYHFSRFPAQNLWKCSWVWVPAVYVTYLTSQETIPLYRVH
jgi:hypothetical protein